MTKFIIAAFAISLFGTPAAAQFHPTDQTYGYVMPKKFQRRAAQEDSAVLFAPKKLKKLASLNFSNSEPLFSKPKSKPAKGPAELSGGAKPSIAPVAPPTVSFPNAYGAGTIVIDQSGRKLYYVLSSSTAYRYPIAVGREGFTWTGTEKISRKAAWPDWRPPAEMLARRPDLPEFMTGGIRNPLGAVAMYLGGTQYRIHGTNDASTIGQAASSGCIRMTNGHAVHLAGIAQVGTTVRVLNKLPSNIAKAAGNGNQG